MEVFGKERDDFLLGTHQAIYMAQSAKTGIQKKAQYGGVVTGLLTYALEKKTINGAILVNYSTDYTLLPEPVLVRTKEEILACAGSKYTAAPSLKILNESLKPAKSWRMWAGRARLRRSGNGSKSSLKIGEKIALIVGLFCMWALNYKKLYAHLAEKMDVSKAKGFDIPYNRFVVYTEKKPVELEFEPIKGFRRSTCDLCYDFTSELADLSVGSTEWKDDWNTLITRTERGQKIVDKAFKDKALRVREFPAERVNLLRDAVLGKKKRVLKAVFEDKACPEYLGVSEAEKKWIREAKPVSGVKK